MPWVEAVVSYPARKSSARPLETYAKQTVRPEMLVVAGVHRLPAQFLFHLLVGGLLDQGVLGVVNFSHHFNNPPRQESPILSCNRLH